MSHTTEQARELWCPMARVAQVGAAETTSAYNRALSKKLVQTKVAIATKEEFELGQQPTVGIVPILQAEVVISAASHCIAEQCAMWRWDDHTDQGCTHGYCGLAGSPIAAGGNQ